MSTDLHSFCLLVTRPDPAGTEFCQLIEAKGGSAIHLPTIAFAPPIKGNEWHETLKRLDEQDWLIFISPQAVYASHHFLASLFPQVRLAAVGKSTAKALQERGFSAIYPLQEWSSEGLLNLPEFQQIKNKKVTLIRGEGGRDTLEKTLTARGAILSHLIVYQRILPSVDIFPYLSLLEQKSIDAVICASFESVQNLKKLFEQNGWQYLHTIPLIVVSERIKRLAHHLDFQTIWVAENASHEAILKLLVQKRNELCQTKQMK